MLPQTLLQFRQGEIRLRLNPGRHTLAQLRRQFARRASLAARLPLHASRPAERPHELLGPSLTYPETSRQHGETALAALIRLEKLTTQIV